jgi:cellulose biosynthesis protein BcsQ
MSQIISAPMTWLDIARGLAMSSSREAARSKSLLRARVGWFGVLIESTTTPDNDALAEWLESIFPGHVYRDPLRIQLEGPPNAADLPVQVDLVEDDSFFRPTFGIIDGVVDFSVSAPPTSLGRPVPVAAVLSIKGGTGRTTAAVVLALRWALRAKKPILLVDADLEAPGISYLFKEIVGEIKISFEDILALAHSEDNKDWRNTIDYAAGRLRDHTVSGDVIVLPLRRNLDELASSAIRPEHLSTPERPYALADLLAHIAARLNCAGVVVDVRAGLVPVGVNLAMDPDVSPLIVSTLSDQALKATSAFVQFLVREMRQAGADLKRPLIVINRVPTLYRQVGADQKIIGPFSENLLSCFVPEREGDIARHQGLLDDSIGLDPYIQVEVPELPDIQVAAAGWDKYVEQINSSGFMGIVSSSFDRWIDTELGRSVSQHSENVSARIPAEQADDRRARLAEFSESLISAETVQSPVSKPLVTKPLAALAQRFQSEVPIAVSEGAKGTGKTLAARYFIDQRSWDNVVQELVGRSGAVSAHIIPACASVQSSGSYQEQVDNARQEVARSLNLEAPLEVSFTTSWLKEQIGANHGEQRWIELWLDLVAWSSGFRPRIPGAGDEFIQFLRHNGQHAVALLEGLEELYTSVEDVGVRTAMRAALVGLPQRLRSESRRPLGVIVFARRDTVKTAVTQNLDQYRREYGPFALSWTDGDVLELAAWLATEAQAIPNLWSEEFGRLSRDEKAGHLEALWGRKLGPDDVPERRTREAYTATWIIAVLSDLQGRLVPRDLIRLLSNASREAISPEERMKYQGRLLTPRALKSAVAPTSEKKVNETQEEIRELEPIFEKFKRQADRLTVPLGQEALEELELSSTEIEILKRHGIMFGDGVPYEVPELFRRGLKLRHSGARQSVVKLYRRARQT